MLTSLLTSLLMSWIMIIRPLKTGHVNGKWVLTLTLQTSRASYFSSTKSTFCKPRSQAILYNFSRKLYNFSWSRIAEMGHFLQIMITRKTSQFLKRNYTISRDRELQKWATFCKSWSQEKLHNFSRKNIQFLLIANCRNGPLSANHDHKKNFTISQEKLYNFSRSRIAEMGHFLQIMITRKLHNFSRKTIQFLVIANCRNGPLSANHDHKKNFTISQEKIYNFSWSRIAEMGHLLQIMITRKTSQFLKKNYTISRDRELQKWATFCKSRSQEKLYNFSRSQFPEINP